MGRGLLAAQRVSYMTSAIQFHDRLGAGRVPAYGVALQPHRTTTPGGFTISRFLISVAALLAAAACTHSPRDSVATVLALRETPPIGLAGDAADDPAIWVAPTWGSSRVIGTQKKGGYYVYDLEGRVVQELLLGLPNNVDLAADFPWPDGPAPIVAASDRADNTVPLFRFDTATGRMATTAAARIATGFAEVYGVCIGRRGDDTLVAATSKVGEVGVWRLVVRDGAVVGDRISAFALGSIAEGCVIDGAANAVYVAQELRGLWRVALNDRDGAGRTLVDQVGKPGRLAADVEGVSLWEGRDGAGYLVVSVQGRSRFHVYDRSPGNAYRGAFRIGRGPGADAVSGTDGLAVTSAALGDALPRGLLVVQDDKNTAPAATQNFKYVSWADVAAALNLP